MEQDGHRFHNDVDDPSTHSRKQVIAQEAISSPDELKLSAKHPEHEHVHEDVPDAVDVMQKQVGEGLPDVQQRNDAGRDKAEPLQQLYVRGRPGKAVEQSFENEYRKVGDKKKLDSRSDVEVKTDPIVLDPGPRMH